MKLKALKIPLKSLNKNDFSHISKRAFRAQEAFAVTQNNLMANPTSQVLKAMVIECKNTSLFLLEVERLFLQQKLKIKHLLADKGTHYLYSLIKKRCSCYTIAALTKSDGTSTTSQDEVALEFVNYFDNILGIESPVTPIFVEVVNQGPILSKDDIAFLASPFDDC